MLMPALALTFSPPCVTPPERAAVLTVPWSLTPGAAPKAAARRRTDAIAKPAAAAPITVVARAPAPREDPLQRANIASYHAVQAVDDAVVRPLAIGYRHALPGFARDGLHNVLQNLHEPVVFLSFLLEAKPGKAIETAARFAVNSTLGVAGLVDVARRKPFRLPYRPNGVADVLGFYGVGPGPYLYLPLIGATTVRDLAGLLVDKSVLPLTVGGTFKNPVFALSTGVIKSLDERVRFDARLRCEHQAADPYVTERAAYLAERQAEIDGLKGDTLRQTNLADQSTAAVFDAIRRKCDPPRPRK